MESVDSNEERISDPHGFEEGPVRTVEEFDLVFAVLLATLATHDVPLRYRLPILLRPFRCLHLDVFHWPTALC